MISYQKRSRSHHKPSALSPKPRRSSLAEAAGWGSGAALSWLVTGAAKDGLFALIDAYRVTPRSEWFGQDALGVAAIVLVFCLTAFAFKLGIAKAMSITIAREKQRGTLSSEFYPGPGLKGHPRLEP